MRQLALEIRQKDVADLLGLDFDKVHGHFMIFDSEGGYKLVSPLDLPITSHLENQQQVMLKTLVLVDP